MTWLWIGCDAGTKLILAFTLGARSQLLAHQLAYDVAKRLVSDCLPVFSSDGLALYFYALTAHFGAWVQAANARRRTWCGDAHLLYAQVVKRYTCLNRRCGPPYGGIEFHDGPAPMRQENRLNGRHNVGCFCYSHGSRIQAAAVR
jgi:hypothetical protein